MQFIHFRATVPLALLCLTALGGCYHTRTEVFSTRHGVSVPELASNYLCTEIMGHDDPKKHREHKLTITRVEEHPGETYSYKFVWIEKWHVFKNQFKAAMHRVSDDRYIAFGRDQDSFIAIPVRVEGTSLSFYMPGEHAKKGAAQAALASLMHVDLEAHGADVLRVSLKGDVYDQRKYLEKAALSPDNVLLATCFRKAQ